MPPQLSADLNQQGLITTTEALWIYDREGRVIANLRAMIKDGEPVF